MLLRYTITVDGKALFDGTCLAAPAVGDIVAIDGCNYEVVLRSWCRFGDIYPDGYRHDESVGDAALVSVDLTCRRL